MGDAEPIKLSMVVSGFIALGVLMGGAALLTVRRGGDSGRSSETGPPTRGLPPRQVDDPPDRAPSDLGAHLSPAVSRTDGDPPVYSLSGSGAPPPPPPPEAGAGVAAFLGEIESLFWLLLVLVIVILTSAVGLAWYITTSTTFFHCIIGLLAVLLVVVVEFFISLRPVFKLMIRTSKQLISKFKHPDTTPVTRAIIIIYLGIVSYPLVNVSVAAIEMGTDPRTYETLINWVARRVFSPLFLAFLRLPIIRDIVGDITQRLYERFTVFYIAVSPYNVAVVRNDVDVFH